MSKVLKRLMKGKRISLYQTTITNPAANAPAIVEPDDYTFAAQLKAGSEIAGAISLTDSIEKALSKYADKDKDLEELAGEILYTIEVEFPTKLVIDADISKNGKAKFKVKDNTVVYMKIKPFKLVHASRRKDGKIGYIVRFLDNSCNDDVCFDESISNKKMAKMSRILVGDDMKLNIKNLAADIINYGYDHDPANKLIDAAYLKPAKNPPVIISTNDDNYSVLGNRDEGKALPTSDSTDTDDALDITEF